MENENKRSKYERNKEYAKKYLSQFAEIRIRLQPEEKKQIETLAAAAGKSVNQYMKDCSLHPAAD